MTKLVETKLNVKKEEKKKNAYMLIYTCTLFGEGGETEKKSDSR